RRGHSLSFHAQSCQRNIVRLACRSDIPVRMLWHQLDCITQKLKPENADGSGKSADRKIFVSPRDGAGPATPDSCRSGTAGLVQSAPAALVQFGLEQRNDDRQKMPPVYRCDDLRLFDAAGGGPQGGERRVLLGE